MQWYVTTQILLSFTLLNGLRVVLINSWQVNLVNSVLSISVKFLEAKGAQHLENIAQLEQTLLILY